MKLNDTTRLRLTPAMQEQIDRELEQNGTLTFRALADIDEQAIERARQACPVCIWGSGVLADVAHHNLRVSELGERSYPCTHAAAHVRPA